ncbi:hypothetical protein Agub_g3099, partial [Astrephomene gubernaculifera]
LVALAEGREYEAVVQVPASLQDMAPTSYVAASSCRSQQPLAVATSSIATTAATTTRLLRCNADPHPHHHHHPHPHRQSTRSIDLLGTTFEGVDDDAAGQAAADHHNHHRNHHRSHGHGDTRQAAHDHEDPHDLASELLDSEDRKLLEALSLTAAPATAPDCLQRHRTQHALASPPPKLLQQRQPQQQQLQQQPQFLRSMSMQEVQNLQEEQPQQPQQQQQLLWRPATAQQVKAPPQQQQHRHRPAYSITRARDSGTPTTAAPATPAGTRSTSSGTGNAPPMRLCSRAMSFSVDARCGSSGSTSSLGPAGQHPPGRPQPAPVMSLFSMLAG